MHEDVNPNTIFSCAADGVVISSDIERPRSGQVGSINVVYDLYDSLAMSLGSTTLQLVQYHSHVHDLRIRSSSDIHCRGMRTN
jgi:hypothetical protein